MMDGGGTSTKVYLYDGMNISSSSFPSSSASTVGLDSAVERIVQIGRSFGHLEGIAISLAGLDTERLRTRATELIVKGLSDVSSLVKVEHDAHVVLLSNALSGCIVISGTGTIAYGYDGSSRYVMADRGWLVGDVGGGFWLGRQALRLALLEFQGVRPSRKVSKSIGFSTEEQLIEFLYNNSCFQDRIASFAPALLELVEDDEEVSLTVEQGVTELARNVESVCRKVNSQVVYYHGGMFNSHIYTEMFKKQLTSIEAKPSNSITKGLGRLLGLEL